MTSWTLSLRLSLPQSRGDTRRWKGRGQFQVGLERSVLTIKALPKWNGLPLTLTTSLGCPTVEDKLQAFELRVGVDGFSPSVSVWFHDH